MAHKLEERTREAVLSKIVHSTREQLQKSFKAESEVDTSSSVSCDSLWVDFYIDKTQIGHAKLELVGKSPERELRWIRFYPISFLLDDGKKKGIGTLAQVYALLAAKEKLGVTEEDTVLNHAMSDDREQQVRHMGLSPRMKFGEYLAQSVNYARSKGFRF